MVRHRLTFTLLLGVWLVSSGACAPRLAIAPQGNHEGDTPVFVPFPPPPARVEIIPPRPDEEHVWIDGSWDWDGTRYQWTPGRWQRMSPGAYYAPPNAIRRRNGELLYYRGVWHGPSADPEPPPSPGES